MSHMNLANEEPQMLVWNVWPGQVFPKPATPEEIEFKMLLNGMGDLPDDSAADMLN